MVLAGAPPDSRSPRLPRDAFYQLRWRRIRALAWWAASSVLRVRWATPIASSWHPEDSWDAAEFLARLAGGLHSPERHLSQGLRMFEAAKAAYGGILFPEWPYAAWSEGSRAEVERVHRVDSERLAE